MVRVATELRDAVEFLLHVGPPDNPALSRLIARYRDIAHELGQGREVEDVLGELLPAATLAGAPHRRAVRLDHASGGAGWSVLSSY